MLGVFFFFCNLHHVVLDKNICRSHTRDKDWWQNVWKALLVGKKRKTPHASLGDSHLWSGSLGFDQVTSDVHYHVQSWRWQGDKGKACITRRIDGVKPYPWQQAATSLLPQSHRRNRQGENKGFQLRDMFTICHLSMRPQTQERICINVYNTFSKSRESFLFYSLVQLHISMFFSKYSKYSIIFLLL